MLANAFDGWKLVRFGLRSIIYEPPEQRENGQSRYNRKGWQWEMTVRANKSRQGLSFMVPACWSYMSDLVIKTCLIGFYTCKIRWRITVSGKYQEVMERKCKYKWHIFSLAVVLLIVQVLARNRSPFLSKSGKTEIIRQKLSNYMLSALF